jgi:sugar diacid utilization regulator
MSQKLQEDSFAIKTSDISLCSTLCCLGYQIKEIEKEPTGRAIFSFEKSEKLAKTIKQYFAHQLKVEPSAYFNFLKEIKTQIYNLG